MPSALRLTFAGIVAAVLIGVPLTYGLCRRAAADEPVVILANPEQHGDAGEQGCLVEQRKAEKRRDLLLAITRQTMPTARVDALVALQEAPGGAFQPAIVLSGTVTDEQNIRVVLELTNAFFAVPQEVGPPRTPTVVNLLRVIPVQQIELALTVIEINRSEARRSGAENVEPGQSIVSKMTGQQREISSLSKVPRLPQGAVCLLDPAGATEFLQQLRAMKGARIIAEPRLLTLNGRPASFVDGGQIEVITTSPGGSSVSYLQIGTVVNVVPIVAETGEIHLELAASFSRPNSEVGVTIATDRSLAAPGPGLSTQGMQTAVKVSDGHTLVMGGLMHRSRTGNSQLMSMCDELPFVGPMVRLLASSEDDFETVLLVTPRMLP